MLICKTRDIGSVAPIHIGTVAIEWVNKSRLLGTTVDDKLSWMPHVLHLKKNFAKKRNLIRRSRFLPKNVLIATRCHTVTYYLVLWGSCSDSDSVRFVGTIALYVGKDNFQLSKGHEIVGRETSRLASAEL